MSYGLIVADVRGGLWDERNLDSLGLLNILGIDPYLVLPKGNYILPSSYFKKIIEASVSEEEFLNPLNMPSILEKVIQRFKEPFLILFSSSSSGMELASYVAGYFRVPIISDVSGYKKDLGVFLKSYYSDKVFANFKVSCEKFLVMTVRSGSFKEEAKKIYEDTEYEKLEDLTKTKKRVFLGYVEGEKEEIDITKKDFLLSIGRGVGSREEIPAYEELASLLNATICGSRPVIDKQWLPKARQVGTSGKTVKPKVYLAMGISGAFQHICGMRDSECIIAVNKDPHAPIFQYAHYGIIADMHKVRDILKEMIKGKGLGR